MSKNNLYTKYFKTISLCFLIVFFTAEPLFTFAQPATDDSVSSEVNYQRINNGTAYQIGPSGDIEDFTSDNVNYETLNGMGQTPITPEQDEKEDIPVTDLASDAAKCMLGDFAKNLGTKLFGGAAETLANTALNPLVVPVIDIAQQSKEVGTAGGIGPSMDSIWYCIANSIIHQLSVSTINWINSGFDGNPTFVDDPAGILVNVGKNAVDSFLTGFGDGFLCKPFRLHIGLALTRKYKPPEDLCTLEEVTQNMDRLLSGEDFSFEVWDELTRNPANNIIGAYLVAEGKTGKVIAEKGNALLTELSWGKGFLPWKNKETGKTITPGTTISYAVESVLPIKTERLVLADEFDEVVSALIQQLVREQLQDWY